MSLDARTNDPTESQYKDFKPRPIVSSPSSSRLRTIHVSFELETRNLSLVRSIDEENFV